jgi:hypothetical protein
MANGLRNLPSFSATCTPYAQCRAAVTEWTAQVKTSHVMLQFEGTVGKAEPLEALCIAAHVATTASL